MARKTSEEGTVGGDGGGCGWGGNALEDHLKDAEEEAVQRNV